MLALLILRQLGATFEPPRKSSTQISGIQISRIQRAAPDPQVIRYQESFRCAMDIVCFAMISFFYIQCFFPHVVSIVEY